MSIDYNTYVGPYFVLNKKVMESDLCMKFSGKFRFLQLRKPYYDKNKELFAIHEIGVFIDHKRQDFFYQEITKDTIKYDLKRATKIVNSFIKSLSLDPNKYKAEIKFGVICFTD